MRHAKDNVIHFMRKPSHVGIPKYEHADRPARSAYAKPSVDTNLDMPFALTSLLGSLPNRINTKGPKAVKHYDMLSKAKNIFGSYDVHAYFYGGK